ncbi:MAG: OmpH family outer membrane protein, partial [Butyrivibrio sp.]|nr:OmpH family outer membrane protein [Butyrivibrio sp.]
MVIFSTKFYVTKELTKEKLIELAFEWINGSPHYEFNNLRWSGEDLYEQESKKQKFSVVQSNDTKILAIRLENIDDDNILWTNDFVYEECDRNNILFVRLAHDAVNKETVVTRGYNRPRLMKKILQLGYGAKDNNLLISDQEILITEHNLDLAENIICGKTKYLLPIIYVTRRFTDNSTLFDTKELAKDLAGTAHVIVEESTEITSKLKELTDCENPFNGAVHIYYTDKVGTRIIPDEFIEANNFRYKIVNSVCRRLSLIKVDDKYTWGTIRYQKLLEKYRKDKKANLELEEVRKEIDKEHKQLVDDMESELNKLRSKLQFYEYAFQNKKKEQTGNILLNCNEDDFYEGEIKDMLLRLLQNEKEKMDTDPNQIGWRRYHVLMSILQENEIIGNGEKLASELKNIMSRLDRISAKDKNRLRELGFVDRDGKHN